jgi:hypothetical protein
MRLSVSSCCQCSAFWRSISLVGLLLLDFIELALVG